MAARSCPERVSQVSGTHFRLVPVWAWKAHRAFWLVLLIVIQAWSGASRQAEKPPGANHANEQTADALQELVPGKPIERELSGGQSRSYRIAIASGQYLHVIVDQRGIDVVAALYNPSGTKLTEVDSSNGTKGPEPLSWIAETTGVYRLEVRSIEKDAKLGKYEVKIETLRQATSRESYRLRAEKSSREGMILQAQGTAESLRKALDKLLAALSDWRAVEDQRQEAELLNSIGGIYDDLGEKQKALDYFNQSLPIFRQLGDRRSEAIIVNSIGGVYFSIGDNQKALDYFNQALPIRQQVSDHRGEAATLNNIGLVYADLGDKQKALEYYSRALPIWREAEDQGGEAATLNNIGLFYANLSNKKALEYFNQALPIWRRMSNRRNEAITLSNIGDVHDNLGEKQEALEYYNRALLIQRQVGDRQSEATTLNGIGIVYDALGENQQALECYSQALPIYRHVGDRSGEAAALNNIGGVYNDLGEKQKTLDYLSQVLLIRRQLGDRRGEAAALNNTGSVYSALGDKEKALDFYFLALPIRQQMGDRRGQAITLNNIGSVYYNLDKLQKALDYYSQALSIFREVGDRGGQATNLNNIGGVYDALCEKQQALDFFNQALTILRQIGDRRSQATTLHNISAAYRDLGRMDEARANIEHALTIVESLRTKVTIERLRTSYTSTIHGLYEYYVDLLMRMHRQHPSAGFAAAALQASERGRARSLLELLNESHADITQDLEPALRARKREIGQLLNAKAERLTRLLSSKQTEAQAEDAKKEVDDLTEQYEQIEAAIREKNSRYAALTQPQPLSLSQIQELLDPDTLLLEYSLGPDRGYLWAITQASYHSYELPKASEIEKAVKKFYPSLQSHGAAHGTSRAKVVPTVESARRAKEAAKQLSRMLLSPVASILEKKRLVVVPDGVLQYLPFAALADPLKKSNWEPLILRHEIVSLPSASALAIQRRELDGRNPAPKTAVIMADPVFSADDVRFKRLERARVEAGKPGTGEARIDVGKNSGEHDEPLFRLELKRAIRDARPRTARDGLPRLPGTRREGEAVVTLVGQDQANLIVDFAATRAAAESNVMSQYRYVLFATHGLIDSQNPKLSALVLSLVDEHAQEQDGYLRAHQIFNLNLPAEVVVLSACETGLGKDVRGEGLVGLTRGFMYAGAKRVVVSLWSVNDDSTAELMTRFYGGMLKEGKRPAEALRAAQIEMRNQKKWSSPYYWAPFVLQGEWR